MKMNIDSLKLPSDSENIIAGGRPVDGEGIFYFPAGILAGAHSSAAFRRVPKHNDNKSSSVKIACLSILSDRTGKPGSRAVFTRRMGRRFLQSAVKAR
jgi:hypothetical protein